MPDYINPQVDDSADDPAAIAEDMRDYMSTRIPGWSAWPASPENYLIEAIALEHSETRRAASGVGQTFERIARSFGVSVFGFPEIVPTPAHGSITITAIDTLGHTLPSGTQLTLRSGDGSRVGFATTFDAVIATGQSSISGVQVIAVQEGELGNELSDDPRLEDEWFFVSDLSMDAPTSGGSDGETDQEYLNRFARRQRRFGEQLVLREDFEAFASDFWGDDGRALVLPLYDANAQATDIAGSFTVVPIDPDGNARSPSQMNDLKTEIDKRLLAGVNSFVIAPTYTPVTVEFSATCYPAYEPTTVQTAAISAVQDFLSPARWGLAPYSDTPVWLDEPTVRLNDVEAVIKNVDGVRHVLTVTINSVAGDVDLVGPAALPQVGVVTGVVTL